MQALVQYKPMLKIECYDKKVFYIEAEKKQAFVKAMSENKFVPIGEAIVAVSNISSVVPAEQEISLIDSMTCELSYQDKQKVLNIVNVRIEEGKPTNEGNIRNIIDKIKEKTL